MRILRFSAAFFAGICPLLGGETTDAVRVAPAATQASIPVPITDGSPAAPPQPVIKPEFQIESGHIKRLDVVESPPMDGLPPVEGTITLTVRNVADPGLPDPPPPPAPAPPSFDDPEVRERIADWAAKHRQSTIAFISATVFDRSRTLLTVYPEGGIEKAVTGWSNLDFNHFSGFPTFEASEPGGDIRSYSLLMGIGNNTAEFRRRAAAAAGVEPADPEIPPLPGGPPAFVIVTENPDAAGLKLIEDLHALYRAEGTRMAEAGAAREKAREERRAFLLANPPKPRDVTIHFWKRNR